MPRTSSRSEPMLPRSTTQIQPIFPTFVMHKRWDVSKTFNDRLYELAAADALRNRISDPADPRNIGDQSSHLGHLRHNFLLDTKDPAIVQFVRMTDIAAREYLLAVYGYEHVGEIAMMSDTFWQRRAERENVGINAHTHIKADLVVTYYPRVRLDADAPDTSLHRGSVRFYDPANVGKRFWPVNNPSFHIGGWYSVTPQEGSMTVFEGYLPHDSTFFAGEERMCIPVLCDVITPRSHCKATLSEILRAQAD